MHPRRLGTYGRQWTEQELTETTERFSLLPLSSRKITDGERMVSAIEGAEGKQLMYKQPTAS
jgi:hypothetical protein